MVEDDDRRESRRDPFRSLFGLSPEDMFRDFDEMFQDIFSGMDRGEDEPAVWGFTMRNRPGEEPEIRRFGNVRGPGERSGATSGADGEESYEVGADRTPLIDVFEGEEEIQVVVEMPGVSKEDIALDASERSLKIEAEGEIRRYNETVELPVRVKPETAEAAYTNGVLEVSLERAEERDGSVRVDIE